VRSPAAAPNRRWAPAWWLGAGILAWITAINATGWWIKANVAEAEIAHAGSAAVGAYRSLGLEFGLDSLFFFTVAIVVAVILFRDPSNRFAWLVGVFWLVTPPLLTALGAALLLSLTGSLPESWAISLATISAPLSVILVVGFIGTLASFPTGSLPSPRWSRVFAAALAVLFAAGVAITLRPGPLFNFDGEFLFDNPLGLEPLRGFDSGILEALIGGFALLVIVSVISRYRSADSVQRLQLKWFLVAVVPLVVVAVVALSVSIGGGLEGYLLTLATLPLIIAVGIAITKYRLYDIDIIINRTFVFAGLAGFITAIYVVVVVGIGALAGGSSLWWSILATAVVAIVFEPVRAQLQRWANRLVYGSKATPYEVLSDLTGRMAQTESEKGLLDRMASRLAEGTGAERAIVWLADSELLRPAAVAPGAMDSQPEAIERGALPGTSAAIEHDGELLGALTVEKRRGDALTPTERGLLDDLAGSARLVIRRRRLDEALATMADEIQESRRRLVDAQDDEQRRLERELHEGAEQQVVALKLKLDMAHQIATNEGSKRAAAFIDAMATDAQDAIDQISALARGIYPPLLEAEGLGTAVPALVARSPLDVHHDVEVAGRHPLAAEAAIFFCISEALTNAAKHGEGPISVRVDESSGSLTFSVTDAGPGFEPATRPGGAGLDNMKDRLDVLGGDLIIDSAPGMPTTISGSLPVSVLATTG
jgi:signal transduction histidine kinase